MTTEDRKKAHLDKLKQQYKEAIQRVEDNEGAKLRKYKQKIITEGCFHPEVRSWKQDCDDGYGHWWKVTITECTLCGERVPNRGS